MPYVDREKERQSAGERGRRHRAKKHAEKYGPNTGNMSGKHGNHARGEANGRWGGERRITTEGYAAVRVPIDHPHAWGSSRLKNFRYAYEHHVVMMQIIGRPLKADEIIHHRDGNRTNNQSDNLELLTRSDHARLHGNALEARDMLGRFQAGVARQFPEVPHAIG